MNILNLGIFAHVDAGKTTTTEQLLHAAGETRYPGTVDSGTTQTDYLEIERKRGMSVRASAASLCYKSTRINLIDTPGHLDFAGEIDRTMQIIDAAILIVSCPDGINAQAKRLWKILRKHHIPTLLLVNKIDSFASRPEIVLEDLFMGFSQSIIPLNRVLYSDDRKFSLHQCSIGDEQILSLCELDHNLADCFLSEGELHPDVLEGSLTRLTMKAQAFPLVFASMSKGDGVKQLLDAIVKYLPALPLKPEGELLGQVFKLEHDKSMGKVAHVRLFQGTLKNRQTVTISREAADPFTEKVSQIRQVSGAKHVDKGVMVGGEVAAVYGLSGIRAGDSLGSYSGKKHEDLSVPVYSVKISTEDSQYHNLLRAVRELSDEEPQLNYLWDAHLRELRIHVLGSIQIEIVSHLLKERYGLTIAISKPSVIYKETPTHRGIGYESYTMPKPCWAVVKLQIDPLPRGSGFQFESLIKENILPSQYQNHIRTTVPKTLQQGLSGWEVTDLKVTLIDGEHHPVHTHPMDFFLATPIAVMQGLLDAGTCLLEPILNFHFSVPEELSGHIIGDIISMRGVYDSPVIQGGTFYLDAQIPAAASLEYPIKFASMTGGKGSLQSEFSGYRECPAQFGATAIRRNVSPLDRDKWILHKRGAIL